MDIHWLTQKYTLTQIAINLDLVEDFARLLNPWWVLLILPYPQLNLIIVLHGQCEILKAIVDLPVLDKHLAEELLCDLDLIGTFEDLFGKASPHLLLAKAYVIHHILQHFVLVLLAIDEILRQELLAILNESVARCEP